MTKLYLPNGLPYGAGHRGTVRDKTESQILPAYGHMTLGDGEDDEQIQINLQYHAKRNHCDRDLLAISMDNDKSELLGNIRDFRKEGRSYIESTIAKNTVVVNRKRQVRNEYVTGAPMFYYVNHDGVSASEVSAKAYDDTTSRYQRMIILNATDTAHPYAIDLFRVKGGKIHDYMMYGSTQWDSVLPVPSSMSLTPMAGEHPLLTPDEQWDDDPKPLYGFFNDVKTGKSTGQWDVTFKNKDADEGARIFMVDDGTVDIFTGKSPSPFHPYNKLPPDPNATIKLYSHWRPFLMVRNQDNTEADTLFVAVIEPFKGTSSVAKVEAIPLKQTDKESVALRITFKDGREDVVLAALSNPVTGQLIDDHIATSDDKFSLKGRIGIWSNMAGSKRHLIGGSEFIYPGGKIQLEQGSYQGTVTKVERKKYNCQYNAFVIDTDIPEGTALKGMWVRLMFGKVSDLKDKVHADNVTQVYQIDSVAVKNGKTRIILTHDPGLLLENGIAYETSALTRKFDGPIKFEIPLSKAQ